MTLIRVGDGVWTEDRELSLPGGLVMPIRMTVLRSGDGGLILVSPVRFDDALVAEVESLGEVRAIVGPNLYHHLFLRPALERFPDAELFLAPGLPDKRPNLPRSHRLGDDPKILGPDLLALPVAAAPRLNEIAFVHLPSRSLVVTDLLFNVRTPASFMTALYLSIAGTKGRLAQSRVWRFLVQDRAAHRASLDPILDHPLDRIIMAHGEVFSAADAGSAARKAMLAW